jgi:hypothetical protein
VVNLKRQKELGPRQPGQCPQTTARREADSPPWQLKGNWPRRERRRNLALMMATGAPSPYSEVTAGERNSLNYGEIPH